MNYNLIILSARIRCIHSSIASPVDVEIIYGIGAWSREFNWWVELTCFYGSYEIMITMRLYDGDDTFTRNFIGGLWLPTHAHIILDLAFIIGFSLSFTINAFPIVLSKLNRCRWYIRSKLNHYVYKMQSISCFVIAWFTYSRLIWKKKIRIWLSLLVTFWIYIQDVLDLLWHHQWQALEIILKWKS